MNLNSMSRILVLAVSVLFLLSLGACHIKNAGVQIGEEPSPVVVAKSKGGPPSHAPAYGYRAKHCYRYYPSCYVYFDISRRCYFYLAGDGWKKSASLPASLRVQLGDYVSIEMDTDKPYTRFKEHLKKYPPGRVKMKKKKGRWS
ncbi:MAG: hypothetical protein JRI89_14255 [Deltaproteobacteria bacterium]|nr:hypothetical protein [Deltaproteobacteria bacterium]